MPEYASLVRDGNTGKVYIKNEIKEVCLAWMRNRSNWCLADHEEPIAALGNIAGYDRQKWVQLLRQVPEMKPYILVHEDWQVFPLQWTWQEILWAYSGVRQVWEEPVSVTRAFELYDQGYSARDSWLLGLFYEVRNDKNPTWRRAYVSTGHNCVTNTTVPKPYPAALRRALSIAKRQGLPFYQGIDGQDLVDPVWNLGSMYELTRRGGEGVKVQNFPSTFLPDNGKLNDEMKEFLYEC